VLIKDTELTDDIVLEIGKFTILWADFEYKYCQNDCNSESIWRFAKDHNIMSDELRDFSTTLKGRFKEDGDVICYVNYNLIPEGSRKPTTADLKTIQDFIEYKGENLTAGAFLAIYRIRNNLLHGLKREISNLQDQKELFQSINKVLECII